jgi:NADH-quinone oxidoreductase subunit E
MLSDSERQEIEQLLRRYPTKQTASIDSLLVVQKHRGWISDEALKDVAIFLEMTPDELDGVATFYTRIFRKPVGTHVISVCDSVSCFVMGGGTLMRYLENKLSIRAGQTTADGRFTLLPNVCLGHCELAPVMLVGHEVFGNLPEEMIDRIVTEVAGEKETRQR